MAKYLAPSSFKNKVSVLLEEVALYAYNNDFCGYTAAREFKNTLVKALEKIAQAPLQNSSDWSNPQRRAFFNCKGQYTLIFIFSPPKANMNKDILKITFTNIYPSKSSQGNKVESSETYFNANDILDE